MDKEDDVACQNILNTLNKYGFVTENNRINKAVDLAIQYHNNINSGKPLAIDPFFVAKILIDMRLDDDSVIVALLYDLFESSALTLLGIKENFGGEVAWLTESLNKALRVQLPQNQLMTFPEKCRRLFISIVGDIRVLLVVLARRLQIMRTIRNIESKEERTRIAIETLRVYDPISERVGLLAIKSLLYDFCFKVLHSNARKFIINKINLIHGNEINYLDIMKDDLEILCANHNIKATVFGRLKTPYSIWLKMNRKKRSIEQLLDIIGFRIIVDGIQDCYKVLDLLKSQYKSIDTSYRNFIKRPKGNNYQSLHIAIIGKRQEEIEIQIRTQEMHEVAESGNAAHWRYKQDHNNEDWEQYKLINEILMDFYETNNLEVFLQNTKISIYPDKVFCITRDERVLALKKTSTPLDLAYKLHSTIGSYYIKAKVNGNLVPLEYQLETGDDVEIITSKNCNNSSLIKEFVRKDRALTLRQFLVSKKRILRIKAGRALINEFFKVINVHNPYSVLLEISDFLKYKDVNALYFAIGKGTVKIRKIINHIISKSNLIKLTPCPLVCDDIICPNKCSQPDDSERRYMVHFATCCIPLHGTNLMGLVKKEYGDIVIVHRSDCKIIEDLQRSASKVNLFSNFNQIDRLFS